MLTSVDRTIATEYDISYLKTTFTIDFLRNVYKNFPRTSNRIRLGYIVSKLCRKLADRYRPTLIPTGFRENNFLHRKLSSVQISPMASTTATPKDFCKLINHTNIDPMVKDNSGQVRLDSRMMYDVTLEYNLKYSTDQSVRTRPPVRE